MARSARLLTVKSAREVLLLYLLASGSLCTSSVASFLITAWPSVKSTLDAATLALKVRTFKSPSLLMAVLSALQVTFWPLLVEQFQPEPVNSPPYVTPVGKVSVIVIGSSGIMPPELRVAARV